MSERVKANPQSKVQILSWEEIEAKAGKVQPKTSGKKALLTYNAQKAVTMVRLQQLHGSLKTCPTENDLAEDPKGLRVELMLHQRRALAWMIWREEQEPSGGILADDMGLGKTLTMISLMLKTNETEKARGDDDSEGENTPEKKTKHQGGTLVVCPASLINLWSGELEKQTKRGLASYEIYHGPKRESRAKKLAQHDMVITTYGIVSNECDNNGAIFRINWRRIVIDEAHQIRNHKSQMSEAVCKLPAKSRWALTGTPIHKEELDMYALLKFLRCSPFDDSLVWKRWMGDKSAEFLHQRGEKNQDAFMAQYDNDSQQPNGQNQEYVAMRQKLLGLNELEDIKQYMILKQLLRLRQICCHPSLITVMLDEDLGDDDGADEGDATNLTDQPNRLTLHDDEHQSGAGTEVLPQKVQNIKKSSHTSVVYKWSRVTLLKNRNDRNMKTLKTTQMIVYIMTSKPTIQVILSQVSPAQYDQQRYKVQGVESESLKARNPLRTVNLEDLPDKGKSIHLRHNTLEEKLLEEVKDFMSERVKANLQSKVQILSWEEIEAKAGKVQPKTSGKKALLTYNAQKAVTMDRLQQLHGSLKTCPTENDLAEDPKGLRVELMLHQRRALAWMIWREEQEPSGGILADDMGLGKTLTMISLMLKTNETEKARGDDDSEGENTPEKKTKHQGGTLVVCPASLINLWSGELEKQTKRGLASYEIYHGPKRESRAKKLAQHDMVITTYGIVSNECDNNGAIFRINWRRIVIDEAHQIRNHKSQMSEAVCKLPAKSRWALTGTPIHKEELDMYALLKFLRCSPFDDSLVWKRWMGDKSAGGTELLHTVISSLMLRRTKVELIEKGSLNEMPERTWELIPVELNKSERDVYSKILTFSRNLFAQFLHQRGEKNQDAFMAQYDNDSQQPNGQNQENVAMRQKLLGLNELEDIKQHMILKQLLRLRQICCHPSLITVMLDEDLGDDDGADEGDATNLTDQPNRLTLHDDEHQSGAGTEGNIIFLNVISTKKSACF
ncbi:hypothetical protein JTB14_033395 [Gonioctena quinquepunctata]|nr:hypothetical protein JTB14_033395 [Gonioctena quinquepunctata]